MSRGDIDAESCEQLERLFLRLASIDDDRKLESFLEKSLLDIIRTMSSESEVVRKNAMEILNHLNRRLKGNEDVRLPLKELLDYLLLPVAQRNVIATNFVMVYLKMAVGRLHGSDSLSSLSTLLDCANANVDDQRSAYQLLCLTANGWIYLSRSVASHEFPPLSVLNETRLRSLLLNFFTDVIAYEHSGIGNDLEAMYRLVESGRMVAPSCTSRRGYMSILKEVIIGAKVNITELKLAVVKILSSSYFSDAEALPLLTLAIANGPNDVEFGAESALKKIDLNEVLKSKDVVSKLFSMYLGTVDKDSKSDDFICAASLPLKLRLLPLMIRSTLAPVLFPFNLKVAFDGLFGGVEAQRPEKLQQLAVDFLLLLIKRSPPSVLPTLGPIIFSSLRKLIEQCVHSRVVAVGYQCFGVIGRAVPKLIVGDMALVQETFEALPRAPDDVASAIVDCLVMWLPVFSEISDAATLGVLQTLVLCFVQHESARCRLVALKYVEALVRSPAIEFRWALCRAAADEREEMRQEAKRLLRLSLNKPQDLPKFEDIAEYFGEKVKLSASSSAGDGGVPGEIKKKKGVIAAETLSSAARYLRANALVACGQGERLGEGDGEDECLPDAFPDLFAFLSSLDRRHPKAIDAFLNVVLCAIEVQRAADLFDIAVLLLNCSGGRLGGSRERFVGVLRECALSSPRQSECGIAANAFALALSATEREKEFVDQFAALSHPSDVEIGVPWVCSCLMCQPSASISPKVIYNVEQRLFSAALDLSQHPNSYLEAICGSLCELLRQSIFSLDLQKRVELYSLRSNDEFLRLAEQMGKLASSRKDSITLKTKEYAVGCLGFLSRLNLPEELYEKVISQLFGVGEGAPQPELQFTVGDSLVDAVYGECAPSRRNIYVQSCSAFLKSWLTEESVVVVEGRAEKLLGRIIGEKLGHANRHLRQAALIWLFILTKRATASQLAVFSTHISEVQLAFINALAEPDEFSQDVASKGLGVVFELGDEAQKKSMLEVLVSALSVGRKSAVPVASDTQLFGKGELGSSPLGGNLTTYQELCSLATDMNQPELTYKFMQLASHNSLWNSKKGAAFGFNVLMQQARQELEPCLAQIVPKLYRYRYDPDLKVQSSMRAVWQALATSKRNLVEEYSEAIFNELLSALTNSHWRVRESGCLALSDLLAANCSDEIFRSFDVLFETLFRLQDDVKESVRVAANRSLRKLATVTLRNCSRDRGPLASNLIGIVLPILVDKGMHSTVKDSRLFSLKMVLDMSKEAGEALKPHLCTLVPCLLDSLSETEPTVLNYLAARSTADELETLDSARASAARCSPMMSALRDVIPLVDEGVLSSLAPKLSESLRVSVGVSTRIGAAQFLTNLCISRQQLLLSSKTICDKLLQTLTNSLQDRNVTVRKQFASAASYLVKFCSNAQVDRLFDFVKERLQEDREDSKMTALYVLRSLSANSGELLSDAAPAIVPYVFLACCQQVEKDDEAGKKRKEMWNELWAEIVPETSSAMRMYRREIMDAAVSTITSNPVWKLRADACVMLSCAIDATSEQMDAKEAEELFATMSSALPGRIWEGKAKLLESLTSLLRASGTKLVECWNSDDIRKQKFTIIGRQCRKRDRLYSAAAINCASVFCEKLSAEEEASEVVSLVKEIFDRGGKSSDSDESENESSSNTMQTLAARNTYLDATLSSVPRTLLGFREAAPFEDGLSFLTSVLLSKTTYWTIKQSVVSELIYLFKNWKRFEKVSLSDIFESVRSLALENCAQRRGFALQCVNLMQLLIEEAMAEGAENLRGIPKDRIVDLRSTALHDISPTFDSLLEKFCKEA